MYGLGCAARHNKHIKITRHEGGKLRGITAIGDILHGNAKPFHHHQHRDIRKRCWTIGAISHLPRPRLRRRNPARYIHSTATHLRDDAKGKGGGQHHRREIFKLIGKIGHNHRIDRERGASGHQQRMAIWPRAGHEFSTDNGIGAGAVFDLDRLAEQACHAFGQKAAHDIRAAARREGNDDGDGARRGAALRQSWAGQAKRGEACQQGTARDVTDHEPNPPEATRNARSGVLF